MPIARTISAKLMMVVRKLVRNLARRGRGTPDKGRFPPEWLPDPRKTPRGSPEGEGDQSQDNNVVDSGLSMMKVSQIIQCKRIDEQEPAR